MTLTQLWQLWHNTRKLQCNVTPMWPEHTPCGAEPRIRCHANQDQQGSATEGVRRRQFPDVHSFDRIRFEIIGIAQDITCQTRAALPTMYRKWHACTIVSYNIIYDLHKLVMPPCDAQFHTSLNDYLIKYVVLFHHHSSPFITFPFLTCLNQAFQGTWLTRWD